MNELITEDIEQSGPLDFEQVWGVPESEYEEKVRQSSNFCKEKNRLCLAWDKGCHAGFCFMEFL